jgi:hypothetical protein
MWKAPGHRPPAPGPSHYRWKSRPPSTAPGIPTATHSLGGEEPGRKKRKEKPQIEIHLYIESRGPPRDDHPPAHPRKLHPPQRRPPPPTLLTQSPPRSIQARWGRAAPPAVADAIAPAQAPAAGGRLPSRPPAQAPPASKTTASPHARAPPHAKTPRLVQPPDRARHGPRSTRACRPPCRAGAARTTHPTSQLHRRIRPRGRRASRPQIGSAGAPPTCTTAQAPPSAVKPTSPHTADAISPALNPSSVGEGSAPAVADAIASPQAPAVAGRLPFRPPPQAPPASKTTASPHARAPLRANPPRLVQPPDRARHGPRSTRACHPPCRAGAARTTHPSSQLHRRISPRGRRASRPQLGSAGAPPTCTTPSSSTLRGDAHLPPHC